MLAKASRGVCRNGPPEAVSQTRCTSSRRPPRMHWWMALCSLSMGSRRLALAARFGGDEVAGGDHAFLVGEADGLAGLDGLVGGFESGDADDGADHEVGVRMRRDFHGAGRAVEDFDVAAQASLLQFVVKLVGSVRPSPSRGSRDASAAPARRRDRRCCRPPSRRRRSGQERFRRC